MRNFERRMRRWHAPRVRAGVADSEDEAMRAAGERAGENFPPQADGAPEGFPASNAAAPPSGPLPETRAGQSKEPLLIRQIDRWIASMERLRLEDYVRYLDDRKRLFWHSFMGGVARGVGMAVGFTILGAVLVLILQDLAKRNLPLIGDALAQIVSVVQKRLQ